MASKPVVKVTSFDYGEVYQSEMERLYWQSKTDDPNNSDRQRIRLAESLIARHHEKSSGKCVILDVGCSVGLFATHFSKLGFTSIGIDFDRAAIDTAQRIASEDGGSATFIVGDLSDAGLNIPPVDIALCFDIFEHLHDDELGVLLSTLKKALKPSGVVVFHTLPMQYDYIFWKGKRGQILIPLLLKPFAYMRPSVFAKAVRCYALLLDMALIILTNKTWRERIKRTSHCNPLTVDRLNDILLRSGYTVDELNTGFITHQYKESLRVLVERLPITHRSLYGACRVSAK